jgi:uncharacterized membrane protein YdjX (TVP38/TMEM64 family)
MEKPNRAQLIRWIKRIGMRQLLYMAVGVAVLVAFSLLIREVPVQEMLRAIHDLGPVPFFFAMGVLPVIGFPVTPFYLLAGATFGIWISLVGTAISQALNLFLAYWLARRYLRGVIERLIRKANYTIPEVKPKHFVNFTLLVKVTPGPPNFIKSFILGLARVPFGIFFIISWPTTMGYAIGVIIFGDSLMDRDIKQAIFGFAFMVVFLLGLKFAASFYSRRRGLHDPTSGLEEGELGSEPGKDA